MQHSPPVYESDTDTLDTGYYDYALPGVQDDDFYYVSWEDPIYDVFQEYDYSGTQNDYFQSCFFLTFLHFQIQILIANGDLRVTTSQSTMTSIHHKGKSLVFTSLSSTPKKSPFLKGRSSSIFAKFFKDESLIGFSDGEIHKRIRP